MDRETKRGKRYWKIWALALLMAGIGVLFFVSIYTIVIISLGTTRELIYSPPAFPEPVYIQSSKDTWKLLNLEMVYRNNLVVATVSVVIRTPLVAMASFTLIKRVSRFNYSLYVLFLPGLMIPIYMVLVSLSRLTKNLGLMSSHLGLTVMYIAMGMSFAVFTLTDLVEVTPNELLEAVVLDGCSVHRTFWIIVFPLLKSVITIPFILDFLFVWNGFLLPMLTLSDNSLKMATAAMYNLYGEFGPRWEMISTGYTLVITPIVTVYLPFRKNIMEGIMIGTTKG